MNKLFPTFTAFARRLSEAPARLRLLLDAGVGRHDMDSLAERHLNVKTIHFEDIAGKGAKQLTFDQIDLEQAGPYAAEDADITLRLHQVLMPQIEQHASLVSVLLAIGTALVLQLAYRTGPWTLPFALIGILLITIFLMIQVVSLILVIALLTIPAAISRQFTTKLHHMMMLSAALGVGFTLAGLTLSYIFNLTSGATIILVAGVGFLASTVYERSHK